MPEIAPENNLTAGGKTYAKYVRHYHKNGDLVLLVGDAAFRVSKAMMAKRSKVFQDMMGFKKSPASQMTVEGIPAVALDDSSQDVILLLDHILPFTPTEPTSFETLFQLIRISEKYDAVDVTRSARNELDKQLVGDTIPGLRWNLPAYSSTKSLVNLINLCKSHHLPRYLPYAYYKLAIWRMTPRDWAPLGHLAAEDRMRVDLGRFALLDAGVNGLQVLAGRNCQYCCMGEPYLWLGGAFWEEYLEDPLLAINGYLEMINQHDKGTDLCDTANDNEKDCWKLVKADLEKVQARLFEGLTSWLGWTEDDAGLTEE